MSERGITTVDFAIALNRWWSDALQFGLPDDTTWSFTGMSFLMDLKVHSSDTIPVLSLSSAAGSIVVDDPVKRILHFNVTDVALRAVLQAGTEYHYDLIMVNGVTGERDALCAGHVKVQSGVTTSGV